MVVNALVVLFSFLLILSVVVTLHELGHYGVAKLFGTRIERFSVGFGKPVFERTLRNGEKWSIGRWPLGGFVQFAGDAGMASQADHDAVARLQAEGVDTSDLFAEKPLWQRTLIVLAGPVMNFVLAAVVFAALAWGVGETRILPVVQEVAEGSAAQQAGLMPGDRMLSIDGRAMDTVPDVQAYVGLRAEEPMVIRVERAGETLDIPATPRRVLRQDAIGGQSELGTLGVSLGGPNSVESIEYGPVSAVVRGIDRVAENIALTGVYAKRILLGKEDGKALGGVVRIAAVTGKVAVDAKDGYGVPELSFGDRARAMALSLLSLMAAISVGLGIANLLPIPMLDGGHLLFYGYEAVARKPLSAEAQGIAYRFGMVVLIGLFVFLTFNDVGYVQSLLSSS